MMSLVLKRDIISGMNPKQKEAVLHTEGPLLIMAGAGSGKRGRSRTELPT